MGHLTLLASSLLISEDFWFLLSCLSERSAFEPSDKCSENIVIARKIYKDPEIFIE